MYQWTNASMPYDSKEVMKRDNARCDNDRYIPDMAFITQHFHGLRYNGSALIEAQYRLYLQGH